MDDLAMERLRGASGPIVFLTGEVSSEWRDRIDFIVLRCSTIYPPPTLLDKECSGLDNGGN